MPPLLCRQSQLRDTEEPRDKIGRLSWIFSDAYAGSGYHLSKTKGATVEGSPLIALITDPPFREYPFIDTEPVRKSSYARLRATGRMSGP